MQNKNHIQMPMQAQTFERNVNYSDGFTFTFNYKDHEISAHASAKSGKETIFVDGQQVSIKRSLKRRSVHQITVDNAEYDIELYTASILKGEMHCSLIEEGTHVATQKKALKKCYQLNSRTGMLILLICFLVGGIAGYFAMTFALSSSLFSAN